jgi:hypothetical protein
MDQTTEKQQKYMENDASIGFAYLFCPVPNRTSVITARMCGKNTFNGRASRANRSPLAATIYRCLGKKLTSGMPVKAPKHGI